MFIFVNTCHVLNSDVFNLDFPKESHDGKADFGKFYADGGCDIECYNDCREPVDDISRVPICNSECGCKMIL